MGPVVSDTLVDVVLETKKGESLGVHGETKTCCQLFEVAVHGLNSLLSKQQRSLRLVIDLSHRDLMSSPLLSTL